MTPSTIEPGLLDAYPFARFLGVELEVTDIVTARLPFAAHLIGNPMIPALHGGVIGAFMEIAAMAQLAHGEKRLKIPKPINVSVQYLRSGKPVDTFARATVNRVGRTIANVEAFAWQDAPDHPIATLQVHFLMADQDLPA